MLFDFFNLAAQCRFHAPIEVVPLFNMSGHSGDCPFHYTKSLHKRHRCIFVELDIGPHLLVSTLQFLILFLEICDLHPHHPLGLRFIRSDLFHVGASSRVVSSTLPSCSLGGWGLRQTKSTIPPPSNSLSTLTSFHCLSFSRKTCTSPFVDSLDARSACGTARERSLASFFPVSVRRDDRGPLGFFLSLWLLSWPGSVWSSSTTVDHRMIFRGLPIACHEVSRWIAGWPFRASPQRASGLRPTRLPLSTLLGGANM